MNNVVVYAGIEVFDLVIYLGQILSKLGRKVLIIDHSQTQLLSNSIPKPGEISCNEHIVHYHNVDYTCLPLDEEMIGDYDDILITNGFNEPDKEINKCTRLSYVTDLYKHKSWSLGKLGYDSSIGEDIQRDLLIKGRYDVSIEEGVLAKIIDQKIDQKDIRIFLYDDKDERKRLISHHNKSFNLRGMTRQMKRYLTSEVGKYLPEVEKGKLKKAMKALKAR